MNQTETINVLGRLLRILYRSLPSYLEDAKPWSPRGDERAETALANIVADQRRLSRRVAQAILEQGGRPVPGRFPTEFAAVNDLSLDYLLQRLIESQQRDIAAIERCVTDLAGPPPIRSLAEEALGTAREHLDVLREMTKHE